MHDMYFFLRYCVIPKLIEPFPLTYIKCMKNPKYSYITYKVGCKFLKPISMKVSPNESVMHYTRRIVNNATVKFIERRHFDDGLFTFILWHCGQKV